MKPQSFQHEWQRKWHRGQRERGSPGGENDEGLAKLWWVHLEITTRYNTPFKGKDPIPKNWIRASFCYSKTKNRLAYIKDCLYVFFFFLSLCRYNSRKSYFSSDTWTQSFLLVWIWATAGQKKTESSSTPCIFMSFCQTTTTNSADPFPQDGLKQSCIHSSSISSWQRLFPTYFRKSELFTLNPSKNQQEPSKLEGHTAATFDRALLY